MADITEYSDHIDFGSFASQREREDKRRRNKTCSNCSFADTCEFPDRLVCCNGLSKHHEQFVDSDKDFIGEECVDNSLYTPGKQLIKWSVHPLQTDERKWAVSDNCSVQIGDVWLNKKEYIEYLEGKVNHD